MKGCRIATNCCTISSLRHPKGALQAFYILFLSSRTTLGLLESIPGMRPCHTPLDDESSTGRITTLAKHS